MPDRFGFDHLPRWGAVTHRCIEEGCSYEGSPLRERDRERHHEQHIRERKRELERKQRANLAEGRRLKRMAERENK